MYAKRNRGHTWKEIVGHTKKSRNTQHIDVAKESAQRQRFKIKVLTSLFTPANPYEHLSQLENSPTKVSHIPK